MADSVTKRSHQRCCGCGPNGVCRKCKCVTQDKKCSNCQPSRNGDCLNMGSSATTPAVSDVLVLSTTSTNADSCRMASTLPSPSVSLSSSHSSTPSTPPLGPNLNPISNETAPAAVGNAPAINTCHMYHHLCGGIWMTSPSAKQ